MIYIEPVINWNNVRGVIFDMDGTLYQQFWVRMCMALKLSAYALTQKNGYRDLKVILHYRMQREKLAVARTNNISGIEFKGTAYEFNLPEEQVAKIIHEWMYIKPLRYLRAARFENVENFISALREKGIKIGIFSDYPVKKKLIALGLSADAICYAAENDVNCLKPEPVGLIKTIERMGLESGDCIMIGDRLERDGICAKEAGVSFLLCNHLQFYTRLLENM